MEATPVPKHLPTIGWREWAGLPDLGIGAIKAKVDTGARTSAIHAYKIVPFRRAGAPWIRFELHPLQRSDATKVVCEARTIAERRVRNSGGGVEHRYIIRTRLQLGDKTWSIELALTNRDQMGFRERAKAASSLLCGLGSCGDSTHSPSSRDSHEDRVARA